MSSSAVGSLDDEEHHIVPHSLTVYCGSEETIVIIPDTIWKKVPYFTGMMSSGMLESVSHVIHKPDTDASAMHLFVKLMKCGTKALRWKLFNKTPRKTLDAFLVLADQIGDANLIQEICMMFGLRQEVAREPVVVSLHPRGKAIFSCRPRASVYENKSARRIWRSLQQERLYANLNT